jgi:hypothetical protein
MKRDLAVVVAVTIACAALVAADPEGRAAFPRASTAALAGAAIVQVVARGTSRFVLGYPSMRGGVFPPARGRIVGVGGLAVTFQVLAIALAPQSLALATAVHALTWIAVGLLLARWCRSSEASPALLTTAVLLTAALGLSAIAAAAPSDHAGAARWIVDLAHPRRLAESLLVLLPFDASLAWASWHVAAVRGRIEASSAA